MFDLGFDVPMAEYQENMDILMSIFDTDVSFEEINAIEFDGDASTSNREALEELNIQNVQKITQHTVYVWQQSKIWMTPGLK